MLESAGSPHTVAYNVDGGEVFEIFQQGLKDLVPYHGGNLCAPDGELALHYAKEFYARRQESQKLWIVSRAAVWEVSDLTHPSSSLHKLAESDPATSSLDKLVESDHASLHELAASDAPQERQPFAIFAQKQTGKPLLWLQDLEEVSLLAAVETVTRAVLINEYLRLWLCPRSAIVELVDLNLLQPPLDRSYRRLDGYNIREKLRDARQRAKLLQ